MHHLVPHLLSRPLPRDSARSADALVARTVARIVAPAAVLGAALLLPLASAAQTPPAADARCITAGRLDGGGRWAPQFAGVRLLDEGGRVLSQPARDALSRVREAELTEPALLSRCDGNAPLAKGDDAPAPKASVPAASRGRLKVTAVAFPKLQTGGELVELQVQVPLDRVVMITR